MRALLLAAALLSLAACQPATDALAPAVDAVQDAAGDTITPVVEDAQLASALTATPAIVAVREAVQSVLPAPVPAPALLVSPAAVDLIIRWEVSSPAYYTSRLEWPIWPRGASGVTWGIGYDGGHQTRTTIGRDWEQHADVERLQTTSGITGSRANPLARSMRDVRTSFGYARQVFTDASLPVYCGSARMAFGAAYFDALPLDAQGVLCSVVYNRGASMMGDSRLEMRAIRDDCLPAGNTTCIATQIRSMCRLWQGTVNGPGLCARRNDEARLAEGRA